MSGPSWTLTRTDGEEVATLKLRADMAAELAREGASLPPGPKWALRVEGRLLGLGGLEPHGAAASLGWLLVGEGLTVRDWSIARRAIDGILHWAKRHHVKRIVALVDAKRRGARGLLERLGFRATARDGDEITMTLELTERG